MFDVYKIRKDFPILEKEIEGKRNTYLDTAASGQKPKCVIEAMKDVYLDEYANVHRGSYYLSEKITNRYENSRKIIKNFINTRILNN